MEAANLRLEWALREAHLGIQEMDQNQLQYPWRSPLLPIAGAATAGVCLDRWLFVPPLLGLLLMASGLIGWIFSPGKQKSVLALLCLWFSFLALGAVYHHRFRQEMSPNDIGNFVGEEPKLVTMRGILIEQPFHRKIKKDPLRSYAASDTYQLDVHANGLLDKNRWVSITGQVRLILEKLPPDFRVGDEMEVVGMLSRPGSPANPGEYDFCRFLKDQNIHALLRVEGGLETNKHWRNGSTWFAIHPIPMIRNWAEEVIETYLPGERKNLARALLLGDEKSLDQAQWDHFQRTGVVHVLAVSGQHLMVLAVFLALLFRVGQLPRRQAAIIAPLLLLIYSLLTGWRTPIQRAFFMVTAFYGSIWFRRVATPTNSFALGWLLVLIGDPTAFFYAGCQLSFLAVAVLLWGTDFLRIRNENPLEKLLDAQRPYWRKILGNILQKTLYLFAVSGIVWLAVSPLIAAQFHLVCPAGLLLGVPIVFLTSLALLFGFGMFLFSSFLEPVAHFFATLTDLCLLACEFLITLVGNWWGAYWYVPDVPFWWVLSFYGLLLAGLVLPWCRRNLGWVGVALLAWLCVGLSLPLIRQPVLGLQCTFLSVGHGSCVVLETPDGRVLLYDAGALNGPDVTKRQIAPFLWNRGIYRIDEVFLSHADLDHFNGLNSLLERFPIGQINLTPSFAQRDMEGVKLTLREMTNKAIPQRILKAGDSLDLGEVHIQVLHPPPVGPEGVENVRSMVLLVTHGPHALLLTGDLEKEGLDLLLSQPRLPVDVLQAPHHGSASANTPSLAKWAEPRLVISSQGPPKSPATEPNPYQKQGATYFTTWREGAITVQFLNQRIIVETFKTKQRLVFSSED